MAGLLGDSWDDPRTMAALQMAGGLLAAGGPSRNPTNIGQGLLAGTQAYQQSMASAAQQKRAQAQADMQAEQFALAKQQREQSAQSEAQMLQMIRQVDPSGRLEMQYRIDPKGVAEQLFPKPQGPMKLGQGEAVFDPKTGQRLFDNPKAPDQSPLARLLAERDALPPGDPRRAEYDSNIRKMGSHPDGVNVYTGTMVKGEVDGRPAFVMPGKDGTATVVPGVVPEGTKAAAEATKTRAQVSTDRADLMLKKIDDAMGKVGFFTTGLTGSVVGGIPGTTAYDLRRDVDTIKANIGFQELQQMREMSPTGGALGQVAVQELNMLQAVVSSLDPNQSRDQLEANLRSVYRHINNWRNIVSQASQQGQEGAQSGPAQPAGRSLTMQDVRNAAIASRRSVQEVIEAARAKGYEVEGAPKGASGGW